MDTEGLRKEMVERQLKARGISDELVLSAFLKVPRELFVPEGMKASAYEDHPLPIGEGQTISQPYMVALMTQELAIKDTDKTLPLKVSGRSIPVDKVLEIGTGSGYQTAILAELADKVYSVERIPRLAEDARNRLQELGYTNIVIKGGDGTCGWEEYAPYDGIIVTAASPSIPEPLFRQLNEGGRLVIPVGGRFSQDLKLVRKVRGKEVASSICGCVFVPLLGEYGWKGECSHTA